MTDLSERERKEKEILFLYKKENKDCELCCAWQSGEMVKNESYKFCVEHWKKYEVKRDKELKEWDSKNINNGQK